MFENISSEHGVAATRSKRDVTHRCRKSRAGGGADVEPVDNSAPLPQQCRELAGTGTHIQDRVFHLETIEEATCEHVAADRPEVRPLHSAYSLESLRVKFGHSLIASQVRRSPWPTSIAFHPSAT